MNKKGFTLVELLVVIGVILILTTVIIIISTDIREKVKINKGQSFDKEIVLRLGYDLIGEWTFEDSNDWGKDSSGYFNNGSYTGGGINFLSDEDDCPVGTCLNFNGNDANAISVAYDSSKLLFQDSTELTVSVWVKPRGVLVSDGRIIAGTFYEGGGGMHKGWYLGQKVNTDKMDFYVFGNNSFAGSVKYDNFFAEFEEKWVHVVGVFKAKQYLKLFINGEEGESVQVDLIDQVSSSPNANFEIGSRADNSSEGGWSGSIDDIRVFREALNIAQVKDIYEEEREKYQRLVSNN